MEEDVDALGIEGGEGGIAVRLMMYEKNRRMWRLIFSFVIRAFISNKDFSAWRESSRKVGWGEGCSNDWRL